MPNNTEKRSRKLVSYIFPVYNEGETIPVLNEEIMKVVTELEKTHDVEVIFVNDGSKDDSLDQLVQLQAKNDRYRVINFSRNFGHQIAISAGIDYAKGDALIIMDSDLQDPPAVSLELVKKWEEGYDVVYAQRKTRKDTFFKKLTAYGFYRVLAALANINIPKDTGDFRLMDKRVAVELRKYREKNRFMRGLVAYLGFKQTPVQFDRAERYAGTTNYPLKKMLKLAFDGITSFSTAPLKFITNTGFVLVVASFAFLVISGLVGLILPQHAAHGNLTLGAYLTLLTGVNFVMLGIIGEYIGRIYAEVQNRPLYIVSEVFES